MTDAEEWLVDLRRVQSAPPTTSRVIAKEEMRILELFSGTGSVGKVFAALGWEVTSLDILPGATITVDVLLWDYHSHAPPGHYDFIWASPPCTQYSIARSTGGPRDLDGADRVVERTLEIIRYYQPKAWLMENPQTGLLKHREVVRGIPHRDVCYCKYGFKYRKATRLWGYLPGFEPRPMCTSASPCEWRAGNRHTVHAQRGTSANSTGAPREQLYAIPAQLCVDVAHAAGA